MHHAISTVFKYDCKVNNLFKVDGLIEIHPSNLSLPVKTTYTDKHNYDPWNPFQMNNAAENDENRLEEEYRVKKKTVQKSLIFYPSWPFKLASKRSDVDLRINETVPSVLASLEILQKILFRVKTLNFDITNFEGNTTYMHFFALKSKNVFNETGVHSCWELKMEKSNFFSIFSKLFETFLSKMDPNRVNFNGINSLHLLCFTQFNRINSLKFILPNCKDINYTNHNKLSCLHSLCSSFSIDDVRFCDCLEFLLENKADPNLQLISSGDTPLHILCALIPSNDFILKKINFGMFDDIFYLNDRNPVSILLKYGADSNLKNKHNHTPLHVASIKRFFFK